MLVSSTVSGNYLSCPGFSVLNCEVWDDHVYLCCSRDASENSKGVSM